MYISNISSSSINLQSVEHTAISVGDVERIYSDDNVIICYINKGAASYEDSGLSGDLAKRGILIVNPQTEVYLKAIRNIDCTMITLQGILFTSSNDINSKQAVFTSIDESGLIRDYLELAVLEQAKPFRGTDMILRKITESMLVHILRNDSLSIKDASIKIKHDDIDKLLDFISENYMHKITLSRLSELVGINKYYLIRLFKQKTGLSPIDYLIHVRLQEGERLLSQTDTKVSDISDMVGFHSPSHFTKTFKEANHCTPTEYRKRYSLLGFGERHRKKNS